MDNVKTWKQTYLEPCEPTAELKYHLVYSVPDKEGDQTIYQRKHSANDCDWCSRDFPRTVYIDQPNDCQHRFKSLTQGKDSNTTDKDMCPYCLDDCAIDSVSFKTCSYCETKTE